MDDIRQNKNILSGNGAICKAGEILRTLGVAKPFVLTYNETANPMAALTSLIPESSYIHRRISGEPHLGDIDDAVLALREHGCDGVLALGGGSVMDTAKAVAMIANNGGEAVQYQMQGRAIVKPSLPLLMIPTTAGTGSEATKVSVLYNEANRYKKSIYSPYMIADAVILDPEVTLDLPPQITAYTGIDALSHAIESYVSLDACPYTEMHSIKAVEMIGKSLIRAVKDGYDKKARADMLYASYFAGCALHAGIGLTHIIAQPLGGLLPIPHGAACSVFLPYSMEFNLEFSLEKYCNIARALGLKSFENTYENAVYAVNRVREIIAEAGAPSSLEQYINNTALDADDAAETVMKVTGHIKCNPRFVDKGIVKEVIIKTIK